MPSIAKSHANGTNGMIVMPPNLFQSLTPTAAAATTSATTSSSSAASGHSSSSTVPAAGASGHLPSSLPSSSLSASATMSAVPNLSPLSVVSTTVCQPPQLSALAQQQQQQQLAMDDGGRTDNGVAATTTTATHSLQVALQNIRRRLRIPYAVHPSSLYYFASMLFLPDLSTQLKVYFADLGTFLMLGVILGRGEVVCMHIRNGTVAFHYN